MAVYPTDAIEIPVREISSARFMAFETGIDLDIEFEDVKGRIVRNNTVKIDFADN